MQHVTIETATAGDFEPFVDQPFKLLADDGHAMLLTLEGVQRHRQYNQQFREPFSLFFVGPVAPILPQRTYELTNDAVGTLEIFIVPIASGTAGTKYQAVFN
jgi:hypothetical protein